MTSLISVADVRARVETDLTDADIQMAIDAGEAEIIRLHGPHASTITEYRRPSMEVQRLQTSRPVSSITSITETYTATYGETTITLATTDYSLEGVRTIRRKIGGAYPRTIWAPLVTIVYVPVDDSARRKLPLMKLVQLALRYEAASLTLVGDARTVHVDHAAERARILGGLDNGRLLA